MALFKTGETPSEEPFTKYLTPFQVASSVESVLGALWLNLPGSEKNIEALRRAAWDTFARVETWWMQLADRTAHRIVEASDDAFKMPQAVADAAKLGTLMYERMFQWMPARELASALFWAWLLQPQGARVPVRTIALVRTLIDRQLRNAAEDIATFA